MKKDSMMPTLMSRDAEDHAQNLDQPRHVPIVHCGRTGGKGPKKGAASLGLQTPTAARHQ